MSDTAHQYGLRRVAAIPALQPVLLPDNTMVYRKVGRASDPALPRWREHLGGGLIVAGLCWPFVFSGVLPIPWWTFLALGVLGGLLRQAPAPRSWRALVPLLGFLFVVTMFVFWAITASPLGAYGRDKAIHFSEMAILACLAAGRQAPITLETMRGIRWALLLTLLLSGIIIFLNRDLFLNAEQIGIGELRESFAVTGFPLAISMAAMCALLGRTDTRSLLLSGAAILLIAVLEVFVRGRSNAMLLCVLAVLLVVGPPWRNASRRVTPFVLLLVIGAAIYCFVLPQLGDSFLYLQWIHWDDLNNRAPMYNLAWHGFLAHPLGQGIGSFQLEEPPVVIYPHNIFFEVAFELGVFGVVAIAGVYWYVATRTWQLWRIPAYRALAGLLVVVFFQMLKAGDIAMQAFQWIYLYLLIVATPPRITEYSAAKGAVVG